MRRHLDLHLNIKWNTVLPAIDTLTMHAQGSGSLVSVPEMFTELIKGHTPLSPSGDALSSTRDAMSHRVDGAMARKMHRRNVETNQPVNQAEDVTDLSFAGRIKIQMAAHGIKGAAALADKLSKKLHRTVHRQKVSKWIKGEVENVELDMLFALADILECSARWLALRQGEPQKVVQLSLEKTQVILLYEQLEKFSERELVDKWIRAGHDLLSAASPNGSRVVPFKQIAPEKARR